MPARVFVQVVLATLGAMPSAFAGVEPTADGGATSATTAGASDLGGAIFIPFAQAPAKSVAAVPHKASYRNADEADLTLTAVVALVGLGTLALVLHRARY